MAIGRLQKIENWRGPFDSFNKKLRREIHWGKRIVEEIENKYWKDFCAI